MKIYIKKSFIARKICILFGVFVMLLAVSEFGIYKYSKQTVGTEFMRLNQASLKQISSDMGKMLTQARNFGKKIAINTRLLEGFSDSDNEARAEMHSILSTLQMEYNSSYTLGRVLTEAYVVGKNGLCVSTYNDTRFSREDFRRLSKEDIELANSEDGLLIETTFNPDGRGVMSYSFQMVFMMNDLLEKKTKGGVVLDISELMFYNLYSSYQTEENQMAVINRDGTILSAKEKKNIGTFYGYTADELNKINSEENIKHRVRDGMYYLCEKIPGTDWFLVQSMPETLVLGPLVSLKNVNIWSVILCLIIFLLMMNMIIKSVLKRVMQIREKMEQVANGDLLVHIEVLQDDELGSIETSFNTMVQELNILIQQVRETESQKHKAELDFLHAQINTHFIHNTLTSIRFLLEMNKIEDAEEMLYHFSKLLRQLLSHSDEFITLREEMDMLQNYVNLQHYRYRNSFDVSYDISEEVMEEKVLTLILQPVVENAIFHAIGYDFVHIYVSAFRKDDALIICVKDDGIGIPEEHIKDILHKETKVNHVGLKNIHERIQLNFGREYGLEIVSREGEGTQVIYRMPVNVGEEKGEQTI